MSNSGRALASSGDEREAGAAPSSDGLAAAAAPAGGAGAAAPDRRFSDKEVKQLLARAVELARSSDDRPAPREGTSLAELERVASEAGLPAEALGRALAELDSASPGTGASALRRLLGAEVYRTELVLDEAPSRQELEKLLMVLPDIARLAGSGAVSEDGLVWRSEYNSQTSSGIKRRVEVSRLPDGRALVKLEVDPTLAAVGSYVGLVAGLGITAVSLAVPLGLALLRSPTFATLVSIAAIIGSTFLARGVMALVSSSMMKKAHRLIEEIARRLGRD
jgi:hypothetical protein